MQIVFGDKIMENRTYRSKRPKYSDHRAVRILVNSVLAKAMHVDIRIKKKKKKLGA